MKIIPILTLLLATLVIACQEKNKPTDLKQLEWLIGTWKGEASGQPFYETWTKVSDVEFANINFGINGLDTIVSERATIEFVDNKLGYKSENRFLELISSTGNVAIFENKEKREKFTFSLNEKNEWVALLQYPNTQVEYKLVKI